MNKQNPLWISYTSINDFLNCPRSYYLRQIYRDPKTGKKINLVNPQIALGLVVHDSIEPLSFLRVEERKFDNLMSIFEENWKGVSGELGGFKSQDEENYYKKRGMEMINRIINNPGPLLNKALKLKSPDKLPPRYFISGKENILLCGKIDWMEYLPEHDAVHIIDFKTGTREEKFDSLQLPIYALLVKNCQKRKIGKISYWYLEKDENPKEADMPNMDEAYEKIMDIALKIKELRLKGSYLCTRGGCFACLPFEDILKGKGKYIKTSGYQDIYTLLN